MPGFEWQEKLDMLMGIVPDTGLKMHLADPEPGTDGDIYVWRVDAPDRQTMTGDGDLVSEFGEGETPEDAVNADWDLMTTNRDKKIVVRAANPRLRRDFRWNRSRWIEIPQPKLLRKPRKSKDGSPQGPDDQTTAVGGELTSPAEFSEPQASQAPLNGHGSPNEDDAWGQESAGEGLADFQPPLGGSADSEEETVPSGHPSSPKGRSGKKR